MLKRRRQKEDYNFNQEYQQPPYEAYVDDDSFYEEPPTRHFAPVQQGVQDYTPQLENPQVYDYSQNETFDPNYYDEQYTAYDNQYQGEPHNPANPQNNVNQAYYQQNYAENYDDSFEDDYEYYDEYYDEEEEIEKELSRETWKTANTLFNLISTIVGVFAVFILIAVLVEIGRAHV